MSLFDSRNTPITGAPGFAQAALPATTQLLSDLVAIPDNANAAVVQGLNRTTFGYRLDAEVGESASATISTETLQLTNREMIMRCVVANNGGGSDLVVQFSTGRTGPAFR